MANGGKIRKDDLIDSNEIIKGLQDIKKASDDIVKSFAKLGEEAREINKAIKGASSFKDISTQAEKASRNVDQLTEEQKELIRLQKAAEKQTIKFKTALSKENIELQKQKEQTKRANAEAKKLAKTQLEAAKSTNTWAKASKSFAAKFNTIGNVLANVISNIASGIKRAVNQFISLEKIVGSNQITADKFDITIGRLKGSFDALNRAIALGEIDGIGEKLQRAADAAENYVAALDVLGDTQNALNIQTARARREVRELQEIYNNTYNTYEDRLNAATKAQSILNDLQSKQQKIAQESLDVEIKRVQETFALTSEQTDLYQRFLENYGLLTDEQVTALESLETAQGNIKDGTIDLTQQVRSASTAMVDFGGSTNATNTGVEEFNKLAKDLSDTLGFDVLPIMEALTGTNDEQRTSVVQSIIAYEDQLSATQRLINTNAAIIGTIEKQGDAERKKTAAIKESTDTSVKLGNLATENSISNSKAIIEADDDTFENYNELAEKRLQRAKEVTDEELRLIELVEERKKEIMIQNANEAFNFAIALNNRQLENLEANLRAGTISEEQAAEESLKLRQRQARIDKAQALFNIGISTAEGIVKYGSNPITAPLIPFVIGLGLAQAAVVAASPIPQFGEGGDIEGKSHANGGVMINAEGGEYMIKKRQVNKYRPLIEAINNDTLIRDIDFAGGSQDLKLYEQQQRTNDLLTQISRKPTASSTMTPAGILTAVTSGNSTNNKMRRYFK